MFPIINYGVGNPFSFSLVFLNAKTRELLIKDRTGGFFIHIKGNCYYAFSSKYIEVLNGIYFSSEVLTTSIPTMFKNCVKLRSAKLKNVNSDLFLRDSPSLDKETVLYMINNLSNSSGNVSFFLHPDVYAKCVEGGEWYTEINEALKNQPKISLAL